MTILRSFGYLVLAHLIYGSALAQVTDEVHQKCKEARDYVGCVQAFGAKKTISTKTIKKEIEPLEVSKSESSQIKLEVKPETPSTEEQPAISNASTESEKVELEELLRLATEEGNAEAQTQLGEIYYFGKGVPRDYKEAVKWWRLAAGQRDEYAQYNLAMMQMMNDDNLDFLNSPN